MSFALGLHCKTNEHQREENIAAVACLLGRNVDIPSTASEVEMPSSNNHVITYKHIYMLFEGRTGYAIAALVAHE